MTIHEEIEKERERLAQDMSIEGEDLRTDIHFVTPTSQDDLLLVMEVFDDLAITQLGSAMMLVEYAVIGKTFGQRNKTT